MEAFFGLFKVITKHEDCARTARQQAEAAVVDSSSILYGAQQSMRARVIPSSWRSALLPKLKPPTSAAAAATFLLASPPDKGHHSHTQYLTST